MKKEVLLKALEDCIKTEESAIPIYTKHVGNTLFLSEFKEIEKKSILKILDMLAKESLRHSQLFRDLIAKVKGSQQDVY